jgi:alcohol dehydrogenase
MIRELHLLRAGKLAWAQRPSPELRDPHGAIVRPFLAARCDGDCLPIHRPVSRAMQLGLQVGAIDPVVGCICGSVPFKGPFAIGHECVAEVLAVGDGVSERRIGDRVIVPWAVSCGSCESCRRGLTSKCTTVRDGVLAAYGFGAASGPWGGMVSDELYVPHADHMLVPVPAGVPAERVAAASDNLADAWRSVAPGLAERPGGSVLVLGGGASSIGLYAAGIASLLGAREVVYRDDNPRRRAIAEALGAHAAPNGARRRRPGAARRSATQAAYDVVVEASSSGTGLRTALRALAPGGRCTAVGYYVATNTRVPVMHLYAVSGSLHVGVSHARAQLPDLLAFVQRTGFAAETVTTTLADWEDAPTAYAARTTKLVLARDPLHAAPSTPIGAGATP